MDSSIKIYSSITLVKSNEKQKHVTSANPKFNIKTIITHILYSFNTQLLYIETYESISDLEVLLTWITGRQQECRK